MEDGVIDENPVLAEHGARPSNYGTPWLSNGHARVTDARGFSIEAWVLVRNNVVERAAFTSDGGIPWLACGSVATTLAEGKSLSDATSISGDDIAAALGGLPDEMMPCALLAAAALREACENHTKSLMRNRPPAPRHEASACTSCANETCAAKTRHLGETDEEFAQRQKLFRRLCRIRHKVVVLSGKGGVGKSTIAVNLAVGLAKISNAVGLLDVDFHGPSVPTMLGIEREKPYVHNEEIVPVSRDGLKVLSLGFFLDHSDDAVIWRGPMKMGVIRQLLQDAAWGDLDCLVIDSPPGTGDEPLSVFQLLGTVDGAIIVTTPQRIAEIDVRKSVCFCKKLGVPVLGVVENMGSFACPQCGTVTPILQEGAGERIAKDMRIPFLGSIPIDPCIAELADQGVPMVEVHESASAEALRHLVAGIARVLAR